MNKNALFYSNHCTENGCRFREKMNNDNFRENRHFIEDKKMPVDDHK